MKPKEADLRDQFAMAALPALIEKFGMVPPVSVWAYKVADEMLEAREKNASKAKALTIVHLRVPVEMSINSWRLSTVQEKAGYTTYLTDSSAADVNNLLMRLTWPIGEGRRFGRSGEDYIIEEGGEG